MAIKRKIIVPKEAVENQSACPILYVVPRDLRNKVSVTVYVNPIGGGFGLNQTIVLVRLGFFWPKLFIYFQKDVLILCRVQASQLSTVPFALVYS